MEEANNQGAFEKPFQIQENHPAYPTPNCPDLQILRKLVAQKLRASAATKLMSHVAFCPYCHQQYVDVLEARRIASELRRQALADPAFAFAPALENRRRVLSMPVLLRAFVPALILLIVMLPLVNAWQLKQNADLRAELAKQTVPIRPAGTNVKITAASYRLPSAPQLTLLNEATHTSQMGGSGSEILPLTLTYPPAPTLLQEDAPIFQWKPVAGAASYSVTLRNLATGQTSRSSRRAETQWKAEPPLPRGEVFEWGVEAYDEEGKSIARSYFERFFVLFMKK